LCPIFRISPSRDQFRAYLKGVVQERGAGLPRAERQQLVTRGSKVSRQIYERALIDGNTERLSEVGVCSLSEIVDDVLMWSHYADSHRGICLQFKVEKGDDYFDHAFPVTYAKDRPVISLPLRDQRDIIEPAFLTKADFWSYEREWRLLRPDRPPGFYRYPQRSLVGVIFGARISDEHRATICDLSQRRDPAPALFQACFHPSQFRVEIGALP